MLNIYLNKLENDSNHSSLSDLKLLAYEHYENDKPSPSEDSIKNKRKKKRREREAACL